MEQRKPYIFITVCIFTMVFLYILLLFSGKEGFALQECIHYRPKSGHVNMQHDSYRTPFLTNNAVNLYSEKRNCKALFEGDNNAVVQAKQLKKPPKDTLTPAFYMSLLSNCTGFKSKRNYILSASIEEEQFPLAFSILVYKDMEQVERLLRAIYRPQNFYCIHVDKKSSVDFYEAILHLSNCFENVFMAPRRVDVRWAEFSVLEPEIICMTELLKRKKWRYFINLTGQEFPLKTNKELVKVLRAYNGSNDIDGIFKDRNVDRTEYVWSGIYRTNVRKPPPGMGIKLAKGSVHITASRAYVDYAINSKTGKHFLEWVKDTGTPDETFFATLNRNPHLKVPGSFTGKCNRKTTRAFPSYLRCFSEDMTERPEWFSDWGDIEKKPFMTRYKEWLYGEDAKRCGGKVMRAICVFGVRDLPKLLNRKELFANKFHLTFEPLAYDCMEELYFNKTATEDHLPFDVDYYRKLPFVKQHI